MMSPGTITAQSTLNGGLEYPENRHSFSLGLDANDESQLIVNSAKSKGKEGKRAPDPAEKPDKTKLSRKDSKKEERAKERAREKENHKQESPAVSIVQQQPKVCQSPLADMNQIMMDKSAKGPKKEKSEKAKSPKAPKGRGSGRASPKREGKKDKSFDLEGLLPAANPKEDRSVGGLHFSLSGLGTPATESDGLLSSTSPTVGRSSGLSGSTQHSTVPSPPMQHSTVPSSPPPSSPPASAASAESDQVSLGIFFYFFYMKGFDTNKVIKIN